MVGGSQADPLPVIQPDARVDSVVETFEGEVDWSISIVTRSKGQWLTNRPPFVKLRTSGWIGEGRAVVGPWWGWIRV
jgi:hypothetical protein